MELRVHVKNLEFYIYICCCYLDKIRKCEICGSLFAEEKFLQRHVKVKHPDRSVVKRYKCDFCSYSTNHIRNFTNHTRIHTKEKPYQCKICSKSFSVKSSLTRHVRIHSKDYPFKCKHCGKKFNDSSPLVRHIRTVHENCRSFIYNVCGASFGRSDSLKVHMLNHKLKDHSGSRQ